MPCHYTPPGRKKQGGGPPFLRKIIRFLFLPLPTFLPVSVRISGQHIPPVSSAQRRFPRIRSGQTVSAGEILGVLEDLEGNPLQTVLAAWDGIVWYHTISSGVRKGDALVAYGRY